MGRLVITIARGYGSGGRTMGRLLAEELGINFYDRESLSFFQRVLLKSGVIDKLKEAGCKDGDAVSIYDFEFDFII